MNTAVNRECWNVRVGKDAFETVVSCYADIHMYREKERERERLGRLGLLPQRFDFGLCRAV